MSTILYQSGVSTQFESWDTTITKTTVFTVNDYKWPTGSHDLLHDLGDCTKS